MKLFCAEVVITCAFGLTKSTYLLKAKDKAAAEKQLRKCMEKHERLIRLEKVVLAGKKPVFITAGRM